MHIANMDLFGASKRVPFWDVIIVLNGGVADDLSEMHQEAKDSSRFWLTSERAGSNKERDSSVLGCEKQAGCDQGRDSAATERIVRRISDDPLLDETSRTILA